MAWIRMDRSATPGSLSRVWLTELVANDQDKTFTSATDLGKSTALRIEGIRLELTTDATVGTRLIAMEMLDDADVIWRRRFNTATDLAASLDESVEFEAGGGVFVTGEDAGAAGNGPHKAPIPMLVIGAGQSLRIRLVGVVGSTDDMILHIRGSVV